MGTNTGTIKPCTHKHSISRILNNKPPYIFEDGNQTRDFIHVKDIAKANLSALEHNNADYQAINIERGSPYQSKTSLKP